VGECGLVLSASRQGSKAASCIQANGS